MAVKYKLNRGTLQSLQQTTSTFAGLVKSFCKALNWDMLALIIGQFQDRIFFGVNQDLIELMKISILNGQRARILHKAGYETLMGISRANVLDIEKCLMDSIGFDVQKRDGETNYDAEQRNKHRLLFVTGRADLSVKDAAKIIIDEARAYLCNEMGFKNINWSQSVESSGGNEVIAAEVVVQETPSDEIQNDRPQIQKRRISLDAEVATPSSKRRNHGPIINTEIVSSDESSENSDVDSIALDSSISFYIDEDDDFMEQLRSDGTSPILANEEQSRGPRLRIIDVTKTVDEFKKFIEKFESVSECGFSLATARLVQPPTSVGSKNYRCVLPELYIHGFSLAFEDKYVTHFVNLQDEDGVEFSEKIQFTRNMLGKKTLTLLCNDAKTQLKTLLTAVPEIRRVDCLLKDPQVAQWLIQPEDHDHRKFSEMV